MDKFHVAKKLLKFSFYEEEKNCSPFGDYYWWNITLQIAFKDRHQWWGREFRCSLSLNMDKLSPKAIIYILYD